MLHTPKPVADLPEVTTYRAAVSRNLARAMRANLDAWTTGSITRGAFVAESDRLWQLAADHRVMEATHRVVCSNRLLWQ